ncbi:MAG TPA: hypothetical protein VES67_07060 [Vicinamibacterales bacterium]|nr:hypothetical protein [Vicinamibacterales bacterium]
MGEDTREIEREIRAERDNLGRNLHELQRQTRDLTDWRAHYRNHSGAVLAAAFGGGLIIGLLSAPRGRERVPSEAPRTRFRPAGLGALRALGDNPRARQQVGETWGRILDTLIGVASAKAIDVLGSYVPGFRHEFESRHRPEHDRSATVSTHA